MRWLKRKGEQSTNSYWDTISDVMSTLLLVLLLVVVLLVFYVVQVPDYNAQDTVPESKIIENGTVVQQMERETEQVVIQTEVPYWLPGMEQEEDSRGELTGDYLYEDGDFEDDEFGGHAGAAVQVIVEDAETHKAIQEANVKFGLYNAEGRRMVLHTYYPTRTSWMQFETNEHGAFLLPERLSLTSYILHELTAPAGYEIAQDTSFTIEESYTWKKPYIVHVPLVSIRNTIHITAVDNMTDEPVIGAVFDIIAAQDVMTMDGTVRYDEGTIVDQIICNDEGEGRSIALYPGNYTIKQSDAPEYYAVSQESYPVALAPGKTEDEVFNQRVVCEKTRFTLNVIDELYNSEAVVGAEFVYRAESSEDLILMTTDDHGSITVENLNKQTVYYFKQLATAEGYRINETEIRFYVDEKGCIYDKASYAESLTNRILRLSVIVEDALFHKSVPGCRIQLYDDTNQLVNAWYSTDVNTTVQGILPGTHKLEISGAGSVTENIELEDTASIQSISCTVWTTGNVLMLGGIAGVVGMAAIAGIWLIRRRKKKVGNV